MVSYLEGLIVFFSLPTESALAETNPVMPAKFVPTIYGYVLGANFRIHMNSDF